MFLTKNMLKNLHLQTSRCKLCHFWEKFEFALHSKFWRKIRTEFDRGRISDLKEIRKFDRGQNSGAAHPYSTAMQRTINLADYNIIDQWNYSTFSNLLNISNQSSWKRSDPRPLAVSVTGTRQLSCPRSVRHLSMIYHFNLKFRTRRDAGS